MHCSGVQRDIAWRSFDLRDATTVAWRRRWDATYIPTSALYCLQYFLDF